VLRNDLITHLSGTDNDPVVVDVNGIFVDVEKVTTGQGRVIVLLGQGDLDAALSKPAPGPQQAVSQSDAVQSDSTKGREL
jgi:hypothetical protein